MIPFLKELCKSAGHGDRVASKGSLIMRNGVYFTVSGEGCGGLEAIVMDGYAKSKHVWCADHT